MLGAFCFFFFFFYRGGIGDYGHLECLESAGNEELWISSGLFREGGTLP